MYHKKHADGSVHVVVQALLPVRVASTAAAAYTMSSRTRDKEKNEGESPSSHWFSSLFHSNTNKHGIEMDDHDDNSKLLALLLPSIQNINKQLAIFCQQHENVLFFDPSAFLDSIVTPRKEDVANNAKHLSLEGYNVLGDAINNEILRILRYEK
jgi:hypothetical protein